MKEPPTSTTVKLPMPINSEGFDRSVTDHDCYLVENKYLVTSMGTKGFQECPYGSCGKGSTDFVIYNIDKKQAIRFGELQIHMIRDHGFFEGNVIYRLEPEEVISVLEIKPGDEYIPVYQERKYWSMCSGSSVIPKDVDLNEYEQISQHLYYRVNGKVLYIVITEKIDVENLDIHGVPVELHNYIKYAEYQVRTDKFMKI